MSESESLSLSVEPANPELNNFHSRSFACSLGDPSTASAAVVGEVTFLGKASVMVWFGWGGVETSASESCAPPDQTTTRGSNRNRFMGSFVAGMPRARYQGAFSSDPSISKLIGTDQVHNDWMASQLAGRLSQKAGVPVFCSCHLHDQLPSLLMGGEMEIQTIQSRAIALVEQEVGRMLRDGL